MGGGGNTLDTVVRKGLSEQAREGKNGKELNVQRAEGNSMCKGPEAGRGLVCERSGREASVSRVRY